MNNKHQQSGFSLFIVLILMLVIALLVMLTNQSALTEMRMSSSEADRKVALSRAEYGLRQAEDKIRTLFEDKGATFTDKCTGGFCQPAEKSFNVNAARQPFQYAKTSPSKIDAWNRCDANPNEDCKNSMNASVLGEKSKNRIETKDKKARYIIEYLGADEKSSQEIFRITSRAEGDNQNTSVTLQSYVELVR